MMSDETLGRVIGCGVCRFWLASTDLKGDDRIGYCCRHAPRAVLAGEIDLSPRSTGIDFDDVVWPKTYYNDWCGEFTWDPDVAPRPADGN